MLVEIDKMLTAGNLEANLCKISLYRLFLSLYFLFLFSYIFTIQMFISLEVLTHQISK